MNDCSKKSALEVIEDYRAEIEEFRDPIWDNTISKYRVLWCLDTLYKLVSLSNKPPLVVIEDFAADIFEYNHLNDIWNNCALCVNHVIRRLV